jgi:hypothetical protein
MKNMIVLIVIIQLIGCHTKNKNPNINQESSVNYNNQESSIINKDSTIVDTIIFSKVNKGIKSNNTWVYEWNYFISSEILKYKDIFINNDSLYKNDILKLCPNYYSLSENNKIAVWTLLVASVAKFESNFDPNCRYKEDASLNYVYSEGLLQLSYGDETRYKNVPLDPGEKNILMPEVNLRTGVVILARQLVIRKTIFTGKHFYWSVLTNKQNEIVKFFKDNINELNICQ